MRKLVIALVCVLLVTVLAASAFAASSSMSASSKTLRRGNTVTLTISMSSGDSATSYGVMLSYDTSVFEYVSGSCTVGGTLVSSANNGIAFMYQNPTTFSGTAGTVTLRVKDTAPFGTYTIYGSASVKNGSESISASGCSVSVSVVCDHSYSAWEKVDDTNHKQVCSTCDDTKTEAHKWDAGKVTKEATCKEEGVKTFTCGTCKATKEEKIEKKAHTFGNLVSVDANNHKDVCKVCNESVTEPHTWNKGTVTKQPTCKDEGEKTFTCTGCKSTKIEKVEKTDKHTFGNLVYVDANNHKDLCKVCNKEITQTHTWNKGTVTKRATCKDEGEKTFTCTGCKGTKVEKIEKTTTHTFSKWQKVDAENHKRACTVCELEETGTHSYKTTWSKDSKEHFHECSACKDRKDAEAHKPGPAATEQRAQTCTTCGYVIKPALTHVHKYAEEWTTDEEGHWYVCSGCEEKGEYKAHDFENTCDPDCSVCGYTRETAHTFEEKWENDTEKHWHVCSGCGLKENEEVHTAGPEATEEEAQTCTICGYELAPKLESTVTEPAQQDVLATEQGKSFPWWIVIVAGLAVAGGAVVIVKKKK